jgi:hypothetical protein
VTADRASAGTVVDVACPCIRPIASGPLRQGHCVRAIASGPLRQGHCVRAIASEDIFAFARRRHGAICGAKPPPTFPCAPRQPHRTNSSRRRSRIGVDNGAPCGSSMPLGEKNMDAASSTAPTADREANTTKIGRDLSQLSSASVQGALRSAGPEAPWQARAPADPTAPARAWTTSIGFAGLRMIGVAGHSRSIVSGS